ncbi:MAG TPA: tRNA (guanosine(46)-N7)-methyltransferase TrmB [Steroidobacteraceae bacterium]|nr:tRNA (guanosine(46)-N7)-methyltransferase TrmB [Steroidobacteraceae bacterium]
MPPESPPNDLPHPRRVRSYVLRPGRITAAQERALTELWSRYGVDAPDGQLDLDRQFAQTAPCVLEIGFGTGEALLAHAIAHPELDHLGIEVHPPGVGRLLLAAADAGLGNLRVIRHDAVEVLETWLPAGTIAAVHLFFPDPWPKKRHHKRRIVQPYFASLVARVLEPGGVFHLATDWGPYGEHMRAVLDPHPEFENLAGPSGFVARPQSRPLTRFELRGQRLGHEVWDLAYRRR